MRGKLGQAIGIFLIVLFWGGIIIGIIWLSQRHNSTDNKSDAGYASCSDAHNEGVYDIPSDSPAYKNTQDADRDGVACEHYYGN